MKTIVIAAVAAVGIALTGCAAGTAPAPTVTVTQDAPAPTQAAPAPVSNAQQFVDFVNSNGGAYALVASDSDILEMGNTICDAFAAGLTQDEVIAGVASALVKSDMNNDEGAQFGTALIVGAQRYLCGV